MNRRIAVLVAGLCLGVSGCGSGDDPETAALDALSGARDEATKMGEEADDALREVTAGSGADAVARCLALAAKEQWSDALAPCSEAAQAKPDDLRIKHAVQQARAAAGEG